MDKKKGGLGRGLGEILFDDSVVSDNNALKSLKITEIEPKKDQPRKKFDEKELESLSDSIKQYGLIQAITVRKNGSMYEIISGERRWRAAKMAGLSEIPAIIKEANNEMSAEMALVENIQRENLNPIEEAVAIKSLMGEFDLTQEQVSEKIGRSRSAIANYLRLLELPEAIKKYLINNQISVGHAKVLMGLNNVDDQVNICENIIKNDLSVRETEKAVKKALNPTETGTKTVPAVNYTRELERKIEKQIGRRVKITEKGELSSISIGYTNPSDLEEVLKLLCGEDFVKNL